MLLLHKNILKDSNKIQRKIEVPFIQEQSFPKLLKSLQSKKLFQFKELPNICSFLPLFIHEATAVMAFISGKKYPGITGPVPCFNACCVFSLPTANTGGGIDLRALFL